MTGKVTDYIGQQDQATRGDIERAFKLKGSTAAYRLKRLRLLGYIEYTGKAKSKDVGYRLTATAQSAGTQTSTTS
jgi:Mn-dependent DtxR family transcriptional regulator